MNPQPNRRPVKAKMTLGRVPRAEPNDTPEVPQPSILSTLVLLSGLFTTISTANGTKPSDIAAYVAWGVGASLVLSVAVDLQRGIRNLVRTDVMALFALYFLTFFEFLLPQTKFDQLLVPGSVRAGCLACVWGFAGLAVGRHLTFFGHGQFASLFERPVSTSFIIKLYWFCFAVGYFYMLLAVNFNPIEMVSQFMGARFSQAWSRGRFGDWKALLGELGMLVYVIPAIAGVVLAKRDVYTRSQVIQVALGFLFTLFFGFTSGTRNIFASYLVTFLIGYTFSLPRHRIMNLIMVTSLVAVVLLVATRVMLEFRNIGLKYYIAGQMAGDMEESDKEFFVDYNLFVICQLTEIFPERFQFMGWEIPYLAVIRPIPRAMWPGKPEGMSVSFEEALGVEGLTLASSFVGEAYVSFGFAGVFCTGLFFGAVFGWWSRLASPRNSDFGVLIYASGFFAAVISMRSLFVFTTAVLPTVGAIVAGQFLFDQRQQKNLSTVGRGRKPGGGPAV